MEGGKAGPTGGVFNELPDRFADSLILIGMGLGVGQSELGLFCALGAAVTAYVRVLGASLGTCHHFTGPMAKQHRMAVCTAASLVGHSWTGFVTIALWLVALGTVWTVFDRARRVCGDLERAAASPVDRESLLDV